MQEQKQQLLTRLKESTNVLVTVSNNPTVDQLAAAIGFTLALDKLNKHATAVFSGEVPSAIDFLEPDRTIRKNTDSLRDFIISLDRDKADKLRYKVEDKVVKIFISPYKTAIHQEDLVFSQGDFNIDVVVAIGVKEQQDLDGAITSHGRILHDATVATINTLDNGTVGSIHWVNQQASSLSEMLSELAIELKPDVLDSQTATALLTGIVAETDRFSNDKTKPNTLAVSSKLMAAGANQQLVSSKLDEAKQPPAPETLPEPVSSEGESSSGEQAEDSPAEPVDDYGTLRISHDTASGEGDESNDESELELDASSLFDHNAEPDDEHPIHIDEKGSLYNGGPPTDALKDALRPTKATEPPKIIKKPSSAMLTEPPSSQDDMLTPSGNDPDQDSFKDPLSDSDAEKRNQRILSHDNDAADTKAEDDASDQQQEESEQGQSPDTDGSSAIENNTLADNNDSAADSEEKPLQEGNQTLADIEQSVGAHQQQQSSQESGDHQSQAPVPANQPTDFMPPAERQDQVPVDTPQQQQSPAELDQARQAIIDAVNDESKATNEQTLSPIEALNAQPVDLDLHPEDTATATEPTPPPQVENPNQPPAVPPPMMPPPQVENPNQSPANPS